MDARIDVLPALGLEVGDAHVLRNAGARVTDDVLRGLALSTGVLGVNRVVVLQHTGCGVAGVSDDDLRVQTGADLAFLTFDDHHAALTDDIARIAGQPYLDRVAEAVGAVLDTDSGSVAEVVRWSSPTHPQATPTKHGVATLLG